VARDTTDSSKEEGMTEKTVLEEDLLDPVTRGELTAARTFVRGRRGEVHRQGCGGRTMDPFTVRWLDVSTELDHCCRIDPQSQVRSDALELMRLAEVLELGSREDVESARWDLRYHLRTSPALKTWEPALRAHVDALEAEHEDWVRTKGPEALELFASWCTIPEREGRWDLREYCGHRTHKAVLTDLAEGSSDRAVLEEVHRNRVRANGRFLVKCTVHDEFGRLFGDLSLEDALDGDQPGKTAWVIPGSLLPAVSGGRSLVALVPEECSDDVLETAVVLLHEQEGITPEEALELARAL
jgi:hypothetical protein